MFSQSRPRRMTQWTQSTRQTAAQSQVQISRLRDLTAQSVRSASRTNFVFILGFSELKMRLPESLQVIKKCALEKTNNAPHQYREAPI